MSFPRYPKYKDSGVEWLGEVPEHWEVRPNKAVMTLRKREVGSAWRETELLSLTLRGVVLRDIESGEGKYPSDFSTYQMVEPRDLVFCLFDMDETPRTVGISPHRGMITAAYDVFRCNNDANSAFVYYFYMHVDAQKRLRPYYTGLRKTVRMPTFLSIKIPVPPEHEQGAIAAFLDRETAKIDALIAEQQRLIELLDEQLKALALSAFITPGTAFERLGAVVQVVSRPLVEEPGTAYTRLGLYNRGRGIFHKEPSEPEEMGDSDFFWVEEGDLILSGQFAWEGAVAVAGAEESHCVVSHRYPIVRGREGILRTEFLFCLLFTDHGNFLLNENSRGAAGRNRPLNVGSLLKEKVPVPETKLQDKVAQVYHQRRALLKQVAIQLEILRERRSALISAAVTGQIDVRGLAGSEAA